MQNIFILIIAVWTIPLSGQFGTNFTQVKIDIEQTPSLQIEAKQECLSRGLPLSVYMVNEGILIEPAFLHGYQVIYTVTTDLLNPTKGGLLMDFDAIRKQYDMSEAITNYRKKSNIVSEKTVKRLPNQNIADQVLLIPESTNDRIMSFSPIDGSLINPNYIPSDPTNFSTPIAAIPGDQNSSTFIVSDQIDDAIRQYNPDGSFNSTFFGGNTNILDNIRGISLSNDFSSVLVTVATNANEDAIASFDLNGSYTGNFISNGLGGLDSPFDIHFIESRNSYMVAGITSDAIHEYDIDGNTLGVFAPINSFPEQIRELADGRIAVGNFAGSQEGIIILDANGNVESILDPPSLGGYRGVYPLGNGNLLVTNGGGVHEIDFNGNLVETEISGVSARFIHEAFIPAQFETNPIPTLSEWSLIILTLTLMITSILMYRSKFATSIIEQY